MEELLSILKQIQEQLDKYNKENIRKVIQANENNDKQDKEINAIKKEVENIAKKLEETDQKVQEVDRKVEELRDHLDKFVEFKNNAILEKGSSLTGTGSIYSSLSFSKATENNLIIKSCSSFNSKNNLLIGSAGNYAIDIDENSSFFASLCQFSNSSHGISCSAGSNVVIILAIGENVTSPVATVDFGGIISFTGILGFSAQNLNPTPNTLSKYGIIFLG